MAPEQIVASRKPNKTEENPFKGFDVFTEKKSHFWHYTGATFAVLIGLGITSAKVGSNQEERNIDKLCSPEGGLSLKEETPSSKIFETTPGQLPLQASGLNPTELLRFAKSLDGFIPGMVRFASGPSGLEAVDFKLQTPWYAIGRTKSLVFVRYDEECVNNLNVKIRNSRAETVAYKHQDR